MPGETAGRPLLPQTAQMQSFTFAPPALAPREHQNQRNYVFVDEHNRHKRLKVMRACEGCRRRKIKCDAATTNSWPCAACIRLKLNCVPPTVSYDKDYDTGAQTFELETKPIEYAPPAADGHGQFQRHSISTIPHGLPHMAPALPTPVSASYADNMRMYQNTPYADQQSHEQMQYPPMPQAQVVQQNVSYQPHEMYSDAPASAPAVTMSPPETDGAWRNDPASSLADALGELKIDHTAIAPYIANQKKALAEAPAQEEYEVQLPPSNSMDHTIRVPPEMMPSEEQALQYFEYFFTNIHPYCPVVNKAYFYQQWQTARDSISPLMLEAIFACASVMLEPVPEGNKWLAIASKHEESFKDVSRLSTMQAMILLLKARETSPKRGYFWRSWMTVVSLVAMAKDLELHEHYETHQMGKLCGASPHDCIAKTRVWHTLFVLEVMIGGPQGRYDFGVALDTVDFDMPRPAPALDSAEYQISCQFTQYTRIVKNIYQTSILHARLRKKTTDWALDPAFVGHNADFPMWLRELPEEMQIIYPQDGSAPWVPSHFIANMHCYHYLGLIMHLRPQLHAVSDSYDGIWKQHMISCYSAAKHMCQLQEAVLKTYGLPGLLCMQRGISFTIYGVLTCTMLHLVAITCPDPEINTDAREFFVRHMRILEACTPSWPMPEMHQQVNTLRQAFSADTAKPFELKPSFPFGSPQVPAQASPMSEGTFRSRLPSQQSPLDQPAQSLVMMAAGQRAPQTSASMPMQDSAQWNPQRIFDQWNVAFGNYELRTPQDPGHPNYQLPNVSPQSNGLQSAQAQLPPSTSYANGTYVTPTMWQDVVASSFPDSLKRRWDGGNAPMVDSSMYKRAR